MRAVESLLCAIVVLIIGGIGDGTILFPPGNNPGTTCDDCFTKHTFSVPFMFHCKPYINVFINENGVLSFARDFWHFIPENLPLTAETAPEMAIVAAFWADHDIESGGKIWTRKASSGELNTLRGYIQNMFNGCHENFTPVEALIATYQNVLPYCGEDSPGKKNTYQVVLVTDGVDSYIMFNYASLQWKSGCPFEYAIAGFNYGDGISLMLPDSGTENVANLAQGTNVGLKGRYLYRVSGSTAVTGGCLQNDKCPLTTVSAFPCTCSSKTFIPPSLTSYDGLDLSITRDQKTVVSQWSNSTKDPCKFSIVTRSFKTYKSKTVPLYVEWMAINIGVFPKSHRTDKFGRSYKVKNGQVLTRGPNTKDIERPLTLPHVWVDDNEVTDIMITKVGKTVYFRSTRCPYGLDVKQTGRVTKSYKIYAGDKYQDGMMDGMCADCDGVKNNDMRKCGGLGSASGSDAVTESCEKNSLLLVG